MDVYPVGVERVGREDWGKTLDGMEGSTEVDRCVQRHGEERGDLGRVRVQGKGLQGGTTEASDFSR